MVSNSNIWVDVVGWLGAVALLVAYALISTKRVQGDSFGYQLMNAGGSVLLMVNTAYYGAYPSAFVNVVWLAIALYALRRATGKTLPNQG
jgi:hypothetical protein